ncbi:MAG: PHP domain-containing protein, partial [Chloroflexota bacterium]
MALSILDLHCHTVYGSVDSQLTPEELALAARSSGLSGCCITEHNIVWERHKAVQEQERCGMPFIRGMEVSTNLGHIVVYGLGQYVSGIHDAEQLRRAVEAEAGIMIAAHPFRSLYKTNRFARHAAEPEAPT